jgi:MerR family mercuric resistance operon transcriptional regulator
MKRTTGTFTIGILADQAGVHVETIRFYQRKGLMQEPDRLPGSVRRYGDADLGRVRFIKSAQRLGFNLAEVADLLKLEDGVHCAEARKKAERKLADVRARLADLKGIEAALQGLVQRCRGSRGEVQCPLIAALQL